MKKARAEYDKLLKNLNAESREILLSHVNRMIEMIDATGEVNLIKMQKDLQQDIRSMIKSNAVIAIDFAKKVKAADLKPFLAQVQRLLVAQKVPAWVAKEAMRLDRISPVFGGGMDDYILDKIWNKVWPDSLNVDDRIKLLSKKVMKFTEMAVKQGVSEGKSAANIAKELKQHFEVEGLERKAAFRLAAHTTNMCYQTAQAEISIGAKFVMGMRIMRGVYGNASDNCDICAEHGGEVGGDGKEYFKDEFGGRDADLFVMAEMPAYHSNCNCGIETIYEDAAQFVENARKGTDIRSTHDGWKVGDKLLEQLPPTEREKYLDDVFGIKAKL